ncbi:MAG: hypothetical protein EXQ70_08925 [Solirubrobacterales bacterium]|nr:hypothetical protein [Solirubrobacterales bacterium]
MDDIWPIIFLAVVLKIPVFYGLWLVWWASQPVPQPGDEPAAEDGEHGFKRWRRDPKRPRGPRRDPHGGGARALPECPPGARVRIGRPSAPLTASSPRRSSD